MSEAVLCWLSSPKLPPKLSPLRCSRSFCWNLALPSLALQRRQLYHISYHHPSSFKEALVDLQSILGRLSRRMTCLVEGLHVLNVDYAAFSVDVGDGEWDKGILHPEREYLLLLEDKEHSCILRQSTPAHKPRLPLLRRVSYLYMHGHPFATGVDNRKDGQLWGSNL